jgi:autotransporter-associated beta strand protein
VGNSGKLVLSGNNSYTGGTLVNGGTLIVGSNTAVGTGMLALMNGSVQSNMAVRLTIPYTVGPNGPLGSTTDSPNDLALSGLGTLNDNLQVNNAAGTVILSGNVSGSGGITKAGAGTLVLSGNDTYTGSTTINGGTLLVNGQVSTSGTTNNSVTVNSGGTLGGSGTVSGPAGIVANSGGTVSPGGSGPGILTADVAKLNAGSVLKVRLNGPTAGSGYDQPKVNSPANLTSSSILNLTVGFTAAPGNTFTILQGLPGLTGTFSGLPNNATLIVNGQMFQINYTASSVVLTKSLFPTTTTVSASPSPSVFGQPVAFTVTVTPTPPAAGTPTGTVTFTIDGVADPTGVPLVSGQALRTLTPNNAGIHTVTAVYNGDSNFASSTSTALMQTVSKAASTTTVSSSANPSVLGQSVTITVNASPFLQPAPPTGTVTIMIDGVAQPNVSLSLGQATLTTATRGVGNHTITATYNGDGNYNTSTSAALTQTVNRAITTTIVTTSTNPSVFGQPATFTALVVTPVPPVLGTPTGTVTLQEGTTVLATIPLTASGQASFTTTTFPVRSHTITASYGGDPNFASSTSGSLTQLVNRSNVTMSLSSSVNPSGLNQAVTFTATLAATAPGGGLPTGTITFTIDGTAQTPAAITNGQAAFSSATLGVGNHTVAAAYSGDGNFNAGTSAALIQIVTRTIDTTTALTSSANPSVFGQAVSVKVTVSAGTSGVGTPTGTITFSIDGIAQPSVTLGSDGTATLPVTALAAGNHTVTAAYSGDSTFNASTSSTLTQTVTKANTTPVLVSSANPSNFGQSLTFIARLNPAAPGAGTPTGTITFQEGAAILGTSPLGTGGLATFTTATPLAVGTHTLTAVHSGDANFMTSTSSLLLQTVNPVSCDPVQAFVTALYHNVLQRGPDPSGFNFWVGPLNAGLSRADVASGFETAAEHRGLEVDQFYGTFLHRSADVVGRNFFANFLIAGHSEGEVVALLTSSAEYFALNSSTNPGFVQALYRDILNRSASATEVAFWLPPLQGGAANRAAIALALLNSQESLVDAINDNYRVVLGRTAGPQEQLIWLNFLASNGGTPTGLTAAFLASDEFLAKAIKTCM